MKKAVVLFAALVLTPFVSRGQMSALELETEKCLDGWFKSKDVVWAELKTSFENYFSDAGITAKNDSLDKQYLDILSYIHQPLKGFPIVKDKKRVLEIKNRLGLSDRNIDTYGQLDCFVNIYNKHMASIDESTSLSVFGDLSKGLQEMSEASPEEGISPGFVAFAIRNQMNIEDLKKDLYQKAIVLIFYFDFAIHLK